MYLYTGLFKIFLSLPHAMLALIEEDFQFYKNPYFTKGILNIQMLQIKNRYVKNTNILTLPNLKL